MGGNPASYDRIAILTGRIIIRRNRILLITFLLPLVPATSLFEMRGTPVVVAVVT